MHITMPGDERKTYASSNGIQTIKPLSHRRRECLCLCELFKFELLKKNPTFLLKYGPGPRSGHKDVRLLLIPPLSPLTFPPSHRLQHWLYRLRVAAHIEFRLIIRRWQWDLKPTSMPSGHNLASQT